MTSGGSHWTTGDLNWEDMSRRMKINIELMMSEHVNQKQYRWTEKMCYGNKEI